MRFDPNLTPDDASNVDSLLRAAFPTEAEAQLVAALRPSGKMVAEHGLWDQGALVGYIGYSRVLIEGKESKQQILGLGPMAIHSDYQRAGHGRRFLSESLKDIEADALVVLGHVDFYSRVGFQPAADFGLTFSDAPQQNAHFMALECWQGALSGHSGRVQYDRKFYDM